MSIERNKATLHRIYDEIYNNGNVSLIPDLISPDYHFADRRGQEGYRQVIASWRTAFPDVHFNVDHAVAEGDWMAYRLSVQGTFKGKFQNIEPTGREVKFTLAFFSQFKDGKLFTSFAFTGPNTYEQLGAVPPAAQPAASAR